MQIYKNNKPLTTEQEKHIKSVTREGNTELVRDLLRKYLYDNHTDEMKYRIDNGLVEGMGMDLDDD